MSNLRTLFFALTVFTVVCQWSDAGIVGDLVGGGNCRKNSNPNVCTAFCENGECVKGDCICRSDWRGTEYSVCRTEGIKRSCRRRAMDYGSTCPYMCFPKSPIYKSKSICTIWVNSGSCHTDPNMPEPLPPGPEDPFDPASAYAINVTYIGV